MHAFIPKCKTHHIAIIGEPVECREEEVQLNWNQFSLHGAAVTGHVECFLCISPLMLFPPTENPTRATNQVLDVM